MVTYAGSVICHLDTDDDRILTVNYSELLIFRGDFFRDHNNRRSY